MIFPQFSQFDGIKNPKFALKLQDIYFKLSKKQFHFNLKPVHCWIEKGGVQGRQRTVSEAVWNGDGDSQCAPRRLRGISESSSTEHLPSYSRGFMFALALSASIDVNHEVVDFAKEEDCHCLWVRCDEHTNRWKLLDTAHQACEFDLEPLPRPNPVVNPSFAHSIYNNIFHSLPEVLRSLRQVSHTQPKLFFTQQIRHDSNEFLQSDVDHPQLNYLLRLAEECQRNTVKHAQNHPFVVLEGLDGTGTYYSAHCYFCTITCFGFVIASQLTLKFRVVLRNVDLEYFPSGFAQCASLLLDIY